MSFWRKLLGGTGIIADADAAPRQPTCEARLLAEIEAEAAALTIIRVHAKSQPDEYRVIQYHAKRQQLSCNCGGFDGTICAHIDAVLLAGERYMVHMTDRHAADEVARLLPPITPPPGWKGTWRRNKEWRGLEASPRKSPTPSRNHETLGIDEEAFNLRPGVVFTGRFPTSRGKLADEAELHGWRTLGTVSTQARILVTGEEIGANKLRAAKAKGLKIVDLETWRSTYLQAV